MTERRRTSRRSRWCYPALELLVLPSSNERATDNKKTSSLVLSSSRTAGLIQQRRQSDGERADDLAGATQLLKALVLSSSDDRAIECQRTSSLVTPSYSRCMVQPSSGMMIRYYHQHRHSEGKNIQHISTSHRSQATVAEGRRRASSQMVLPSSREGVVFYFVFASSS